MNASTAGLSVGATTGVRAALRVIWKSRVSLSIITVSLTVVGIATGFLIPKQYRAEILISPIDSPTSSSGGLGGMASQYGALASLAGISLSGKGSKEEAIAVLQSELITESYVRDNDLLPVLYPARWNSQLKTWVSSDPKKKPSLWLANQFFKKNIREVKEDKQTGLVTLRITWRDPVIAARWANDLVKLTNQYLREKAIRESDRNIAYLNEQATQTSILEAKNAIYSLLKEEINKQMIARGREEYAIKVLDPARPPEQRSSPSPAILGIAGFITGIVLSAFLMVQRSLASKPI